MSDALAAALEAARSRLASGVEDAEAELRRARVRARELRDTVTLAREFAGIGAGIEASAPPANSDPVARPHDMVVDLSNLDGRRPEPSSLSVRRRAALEVIRLSRRPRRMWASFSPDVVLQWEGDSPFAGTYAGRTEVLALLELVLRQIDRTVDPEPDVRAEGVTIRIAVRPGLRRAKGVRLSVTAIIGFDERDRIDQLVITPEEGVALDHLLDAIISAGKR